MANDVDILSAAIAAARVKRQWSNATHAPVPAAAEEVPSVKAEDEVRCEKCGSLKDHWRTSPETSSTTNDDDQNVGDRPVDYANLRQDPNWVRAVLEGRD